MKKLGKITVLLLLTLLLFACRSQPASENQEAVGQPSSQPATQAEIEAALETIYEQYAANLILEGARSYTVVRGDTLSRISRQFYGNGFYFPIIMMASRDLVVDHDRITPGMVLTIPDLQANLNNTGARGVMKNLFSEVAIIEDQRNRHDTADGLRSLADSL